MFGFSDREAAAAGAAGEIGPLFVNTVGSRVVSSRCIRLLAESGRLHIVLDGSIGRARRRARRTVPKLQVTQDLLYGQAVADQADDFRRSGETGDEPAIMRRLIYYVVV